MTACLTLVERHRYYILMPEITHVREDTNFSPVLHLSSVTSRLDNAYMLGSTVLGLVLPLHDQMKSNTERDEEHPFAKLVYDFV